MMNVKLRPAPIRVNVIFKPWCPCVMVRNGYYNPIFVSVNKWNRVQDTSRLKTKFVWFSSGGMHEGVCSPRPSISVTFGRIYGTIPH